ncbi:MAG: phage/plasmid primase, P4 family [Corynebacterium provencense]|uniref:DNA primase family protein n=1 Tax=Corynebacterium provencense TaxID=1737425 RepID=UPI002989BAC9|nr:phage/plasmid primase, P4 family [Corynebacterium provencense]
MADYDKLPVDVKDRAADLMAKHGMPWEKAVQQAQGEQQELPEQQERPTAENAAGPPYPRPGDPTNVARRILTDLFTDPGTGSPTLHYWRGDWYRWTGPCWTPLPDEELTGEVWLHLDAQVYAKDDEVVNWCPTGSKVADVRRALLYLVHLPDNSEAPMWITGADSTRDPAKIIGMNNGLLHWPDRTLLDHTPDLFNVYALPYAYDPDANCPRWLRFIESTFDADPAGALAAQEFFGYALSGDTTRQKGMMLIGPPGGGKGTLSNVLTAMVGESNVTSTDPKTLDSRFGLWPLIGKPLAVLSDARSDGPVNAGALGNLLRIMGGDPVNIDRKNAGFWNGYLPTRFVWISNELPRFTDNSGAILRRWIVLRLSTSVPEENRDKDLGAKLRAELSGILNWALQGLDALNGQGHFTKPGTQAEALDDLRDSVSPVSAFLRDCYNITGNQEDIVPLSEVLQAYGTWASDNGYQAVNRSTLMDRIKGCPEPVDAKNTVTAAYPKKTRLVFGIKRGPL